SLALMALALATGTGHAGESPPPELLPVLRTANTGGAVPGLPPLAPKDGEILPASGCASCGSGGGPMMASPGVYGWGKYPADPCLVGGGCEGCGEAGCVAGRAPCATCEGHGHLGRLWCAFHNALCCPDPCYEPKWTCGANAALFVDFARPATLTRFRWDYGNDLTQPDRAEAFWAAIGLKGPANPERRVDYHELRCYQEL